MTEEINRQVNFWDSVAWDKEFSLPLDIASFEALVADDEMVLDFGCGYGRIVGLLEERGYTKITGVDISSEMISRASKEHPASDFAILEGTQMPYLDNTFNAALLIAVLTSVPSDDSQKQIIKELYRVLKPGGFIYVSDFCIQKDNRNAKRYKEFEKKYGKHGVFQSLNGAVLRHHDMIYIRKLLTDFELISITVNDAVTMNNNPAKAFRFLGRKPCDYEE